MLNTGIVKYLHSVWLVMDRILFSSLLFLFIYFCPYNSRVRLKLCATVFSALKLQKSKVISGSHHVDELGEEEKEMK